MDFIKGTLIAHLKGHKPVGKPTKPNLVTIYQLLPCGKAAILVYLKVCWGRGGRSAVFKGLFVEH